MPRMQQNQPPASRTEQTMTTQLDREAIEALFQPAEPRPDDPDTWRIPPLEEIQQNAAESPEGPLMILGGAGTGKSHTLLARKVMLAKAGAPPGTIATITFNARASRRIRLQLQEIVGGDPAELGFFTGTLHSYCSMMLRQAGWRACGIKPNFSIWDKDQSIATLQQIVAGDAGEGAGRLPSELENILEWINRNNTLRRDEQQPAEQEVWHAYAEAYEAEKRAQNSVDFTDLLVKAREALENDRRLREAYASVRTRHLIVDEFQDLTAIHYEIIRLMTGPTNSLTVALDPNQSIYGWRGAAPDLMDRFRYDYPDVRMCGLTINHRTAASVMRSWRTMAQHEGMTGLVDDYQRALRPANRRPEERAVAGNPTRQYVQIANDIKEMIDKGEYKPEDFAVLIRRRKGLETLALAIDNLKLPYNIVGGEEEEKDADAQAIVAMLTLATNPQNVWALRKGADCNTQKKYRNLNHRITRDIQKMAQENETNLIEAAKIIRSRIDHEAIYAQLGYAIDTYEEIREMMERDTEVAQLITRIHGRMYEVSLGRQQNQMNPEVMKLLTLAQRSDRDADERFDTERRTVAFLERLANAADPEQESDENSDPTALRNGITLATIHSSKGLQWPVVMIADLEEGEIPGSKTKDGTPRIEEEQRLLYVALTRAEDVYYLYWPEQKEDGSRGAPCRFIDALMLRGRRRQPNEDAEALQHDDSE